MLRRIRAILDTETQEKFLPWVLRQRRAVCDIMNHVFNNIPTVNRVMSSIGLSGSLGTAIIYGPISNKKQLRYHSILKAHLFCAFFFK